MNDEIAPILNEMSAFLLASAQQDPAGGAKFWAPAILLQQLADIVDDRASSCLAQAATIRGIIDDTCSLMPPSAAADLAAMIPAPPTAPGDFQARRLGEYLDKLNAALIVAHSWLETCDMPGGKKVIARIWDYLEPLAKHESRLVPRMW